MKKSTIDKLCEAINKARNVAYPEIGYLYFADVWGDGRNVRKVYRVCNNLGAVERCHNASSYKQTAQNLREVLAVQGIY